MLNSKTKNGSIHQTPKHLKELLATHKKAQEAWQDITPLARNEWICWVESAKKEETRLKRSKEMISKLNAGKRRPCCWAGCTHR